MWDTFVHIALLVVWKKSSFVKDYMIVVCQIEYAAYYVITLFSFVFRKESHKLPRMVKSDV